AACAVGRRLVTVSHRRADRCGALRREQWPGPGHGHVQRPLPAWQPVRHVARRPAGGLPWLTCTGLGLRLAVAAGLATAGVRLSSSHHCRARASAKHRPGGMRSNRSRPLGGTAHGLVHRTVDTGNHGLDLERPDRALLRLDSRTARRAAQRHRAFRLAVVGALGLGTLAGQPDGSLVGWATWAAALAGRFSATRRIELLANGDGSAPADMAGDHPGRAVDLDRADYAGRCAGCRYRQADRR